MESDVTVAKRFAVIELVTVPVKSEAVATCSVYVSPTGDEADHDAVRLLFVDAVNVGAEGAVICDVCVLANTRYAVCAFWKEIAFTRP